MPRPPDINTAVHFGRLAGATCEVVLFHMCRLMFGTQRTTISAVARGCSAVGSASPCQGEGRGFESRHPLEGVKWHQTLAVEWPSGEATACKAVHTGSIPVSTSISII